MLRDMAADTNTGRMNKQQANARCARDPAPSPNAADPLRPFAPDTDPKAHPHGAISGRHHAVLSARALSGSRTNNSPITPPIVHTAIG